MNMIKLKTRNCINRESLYFQTYEDVPQGM